MSKNPKTNDHAGLRCRLVRHWEAWRGPATGHTALAMRHLKTCAECQAFFTEDVSFENQLRGAACVEKTAMAAALQSDFEQRILRAVRASQPEPEQPKQGSRGISLTWSLAGAAAAIALALAVAQWRVPDKAGPELVASQEVQAGTPDAQESSLRWWSSLEARESALELATHNPLEQEIESISANAQSVLGFLALNFLPTEPVKNPAG
jgi:hypothetical protein